MADIVLTVLGSFGLRATGSAGPVTLPTKKCRALLAYLALDDPVTDRHRPEEHHRRNVFEGGGVDFQQAADRVTTNGATD